MIELKVKYYVFEDIYSNCFLFKTVHFCFCRGAEFRQEYGKLSELRSILPNDVTFAALTATATKAMRSEILKKLDMADEKTTTIYQLPDRHNITYTVKKSNRDLRQLQWLLTDVLTNKSEAKKTVVYCCNIATCATLYEHFNMHLHQSDILEDRLIAMFHRSTATMNKEHVLGEFSKKDSKLRIVFATVAFGMDIDIPDRLCHSLGCSTRIGTVCSRVWACR